MCKEDSDIQWLDLNKNPFIIQALLRAKEIIELIKMHNKCAECKLLEKILNIVKKLRDTSINEHICLFPIKDLLLSTFDEFCCETEENNVCREVWELLKDMFDDPSKAKETYDRLGCIFKRLYIKFEREEDL